MYVCLQLPIFCVCVVSCVHLGVYGSNSINSSLISCAQPPKIAFERTNWHFRYERVPTFYVPFSCYHPKIEHTSIYISYVPKSGAKFINSTTKIEIMGNINGRKKWQQMKYQATRI